MCNIAGSVLHIQNVQDGSAFYLCISPFLNSCLHHNFLYRCSLLELASSFCKGARRALLDKIFDFVRDALLVKWP